MGGEGGEAGWGDRRDLHPGELVRVKILVGSFFF